MPRLYARMESKSTGTTSVMVRGNSPVCRAQSARRKTQATQETISSAVESRIRAAEGCDKCELRDREETDAARFAEPDRANEKAHWRSDPRELEQDHEGRPTAHPAPERGTGEFSTPVGAGGLGRSACRRCESGRVRPRVTPPRRAEPCVTTARTRGILSRRPCHPAPRSVGRPCGAVTGGEGSSAGRAPGCGPGGRGFESRPSPHHGCTGRRGALAVDVNDRCGCGGTGRRARLRTW